MSATRIAAEAVHRLEFSSLPADVVTVAENSILDTMGVMVAAAREPSTRLLSSYLRANGGTPESTVLAQGWRTGASDAAFIHGQMAAVLLYDDCHNGMRGHPSCGVVPVILSLGEVLDVTGEEAITAFVLGTEMQCKLGTMLNPTQYAKGWHATSTQGVLGATVTAAKLLKLSPEQIEHALGIALSCAGGSRQSFGTMTMAFHSGHAARNGIMAAQLAHAGFESRSGAFESRMGLQRLLSEQTTPSPEQVMDGLGIRYDMIDPGIIYKPYPLGRPAHNAVDAALALVREHDIDPSAVTTIRCGVCYLIPQTLIHPRPTTPLQCKTSMQYTVAAAVLDRKVTLESFGEQEIARPEVRRLLDCVEVYVPPELDETNPEVAKDPFFQPTTVTIVSDGVTYEKTLKFHKGTVQNPMSRDELVGKFVGCLVAATTVSEAEARQIADSVYAFKGSSIRKLIGSFDRVLATETVQHSEVL